MTENTAVPLNSAGHPCDAQREISRADDGIRKKQLASGILVEQGRELASERRIELRTQVLVLKNVGLDLGVVKLGRVHILHLVRKSGRNLTVSDKKPLKLTERCVAALRRAAESADRRGSSRAVHVGGFYFLYLFCECSHCTAFRFGDRVIFSLLYQSPRRVSSKYAVFAKTIGAAQSV